MWGKSVALVSGFGGSTDTKNKCEQGWCSRAVPIELSVGHWLLTLLPIATGTVPTNHFKN